MNIPATILAMVFVVATLPEFIIKLRFPNNISISIISDNICKNYSNNNIDITNDLNKPGYLT